MCVAKILNISVALIVTAAVASSTLAQDFPNGTNVVEGGSSCEMNSLYLDVLSNEAQTNEERIFVIARLGKGEPSRYLNYLRLESSRNYLSYKPIKAERFVFAEGERVAGKGRVEFYLGSKLFLVSLIERGKQVCNMCCEDPLYIPPTKKAKKRKRS